MHGQKRPRKRALEGTLTVEGFELRWHLHSEPQWTAEHGDRGLCISVQDALGKRRELMLEYPFPGKTPSGREPDRPKISDGMIESAVRLAMAAGWAPTLKGRVFTFPVPEPQTEMERPARREKRS